MKRYFRRLSRLLSRYGAGQGRGLNINDFRMQGHSIKQLHLGCGNNFIRDWCNVDIIKTGATDLIMDIRTLSGIPDNSVHIIYSCHALEHFKHKDIPGILSRWHDVLIPGGEIRISVPDLDAITRIYQKNLDHFNKPGNQPWIALFYGGQKDSYDFHYTGFNYCWLSYLLNSAGFINIVRYPNKPHFIKGMFDNSMATEPFGEYISLNIMAQKRC